MKNAILIFFLFFSGGLMAQNSSFGLGIAAVNLDKNSGLYFTGNVRIQFTNTIGWQTEVGYASVAGTTTFLKEERLKAMTLKSGLAAKFFEKSGFRGEAIIGGGIYKESNDKFYGLLSGELFLSAQIGKNLIAGIPLSYNFITWEREEFYTAGISLRFHM